MVNWRGAADCDKYSDCALRGAKRRMNGRLCLVADQCDVQRVLQLTNQLVALFALEYNKHKHKH